MAERRVRVAYLLTHYPRTTQTFIDAEIRALTAGGHEVVVFALNEPTDESRHAVGSVGDRPTTVYLKRRGVRRAVRAGAAAARRGPGALIRAGARALASGGTDLRRLGRRVLHLGEALVVWDECRRRGVSVIHAHFGQTTSTVAWLAAALADDIGAGPSDWVFTVHCGSEVEDRGETIVARKAAHARAVVAISDHTRAQLMRQLPERDWAKVEVIRCGVDLDRFEFRPQLRRAEAASATVLFVGRLDVAKGVPVLLRAGAELRDRSVDLRLRIVGTGPMEGALRDEARGCEWIEFVGELAPEQVLDELRLADVFCLPSLDEGIPVSIMEAMAIGTPVVATLIAGIPELAQDGRTAHVVPAGNVSALADALQASLSGGADVEAMRLAARQRVESLHDGRRNLADLVELLTRAAS